MDPQWLGQGAERAAPPSPPAGGGRRSDSAGSIPTPVEIPRATEDFLALEASGWKAQRGALLGHPSLATFVRSATRLLAREGKCQIHSLELDGKPIAMGVVIESGGRAYFWKIAYDEAWRAQAPGVQLVYALTETQTQRAEIETDRFLRPPRPYDDRALLARAARRLRSDDPGEDRRRHPIRRGVRQGRLAPTPARSGENRSITAC